MGRSKLPLLKIASLTNRQVTFSKRRNGILKKVYELSVLCDVDVAIIMFSPSGRLTHFSRRRRLEDILSELVNLPDSERGFHISNKESLLWNLRKIEIEDKFCDIERVNPAYINSNDTTKKIQEEINVLHSKLDEAERLLRIFEPDTKKITSAHELDLCEKHLQITLQKVRQRMEQLSGNHIHSFEDNTEQMDELFQYLENNAQAEETNPSSFEEIPDDLWLDVEDYNNSISPYYTASETSSFSQSSMNMPYSTSVYHDAMSQTSISGDQTYSLNDENFKHSMSRKFPALTPLQTSFTFAQPEMETPTSALRPVSPYLQGEAAASSSQQQPSSSNQRNHIELETFQPNITNWKYQMSQTSTSGDFYAAEGSFNHFHPSFTFAQAEMGTPTSALRPLTPYLQIEAAAASSSSQQQPPSSNINHGKRKHIELEPFQPNITNLNYQTSQTSTSGDFYAAEGSFNSLTDENFNQSQFSAGRVFPHVTPLQTSFSFAMAELESPTSTLRPVAPYLLAEAQASPSHQQLSSSYNEEDNHELTWFQPNVKRPKYHHQIDTNYI